MNRSIAVGIFCYNRVGKLRSCIEALLTNPECRDLQVVFFSDGYKNQADKAGVLEVRSYIDTLQGFGKIIKQYRVNNLSTGPNFRTGLQYMSDNYQEFIIVEDDLIVSPNYLKYLLDALTFYRNSESVFCVTAYVFPITKKGYTFDTIVYKRFCSWGWATWSDRLKNVVWDSEELEKMTQNSPEFKKILNAEGHDLFRMLKKQIAGVISTWDIQMQVHVSKHRLKVIYPVLSKVNNIGFDQESTNTFGLNYLGTPFDNSNKREFNFCSPDLVIPKLQKQIKRPYTLIALVVRKIFNEMIRTTSLLRMMSYNNFIRNNDNK